MTVFGRAIINNVNGITGTSIENECLRPMARLSCYLGIYKNETTVQDDHKYCNNPFFKRIKHLTMI